MDIEALTHPKIMIRGTVLKTGGWSLHTENLALDAIGFCKIVFCVVNVFYFRVIAFVLAKGFMCSLMDCNNSAYLIIAPYSYATYRDCFANMHPLSQSKKTNSPNLSQWRPNTFIVGTKLDAGCWILDVGRHHVFGVGGY